jgi:uncharacterized protein (DUF58 family)
VSPAPRAALAAAVVAVLAWFLPAGAAVLAGLALAGAVVADAWSVRRPPTVERSVPRVLSRGVTAPLVIAPVSATRGRARLRQPVPPALAVEPDEADDHLDAVLRPRHRGRHRLPPVAVRLTGPLGLGRWDHRAGGEEGVVVYPDLPAARALARAVRSGMARDLAQLTRGALGLGTELERVRDYLPDDELRQVNWKATARLGRPMSNEYRLDEDRDVICVVDVGRLMAAPLGGDRTRLDAALDAAAAVAVVADAVGDRCGAVAFDNGVRRLVRPRRAGGRPVLDALFDLEPSAVDSDYAAAFHAVGGGKRACVVVLTDLVDEAAARSLVDAVPVLARRHAVVVATATDDDLLGLVATEPATTLQVHAASVAADVLEARARAATRLRQSGAVVVEASAGRLGRVCVSAYLSLKARARL